MAVIRPENLSLVGGYRIPTFSGVTYPMAYPWGGMAFYTNGSGDRFCWVENGEQGKEVLECTTSASMGSAGADPATWPLMTHGMVWNLSTLFPGVSLTQYMFCQGFAYDGDNDRLWYSLRSRYATAPDATQWVGAIDYPGKTVNSSAKPTFPSYTSQRYGGGMGMIPAAWATTHTSGKRLGFFSGGLTAGQGAPAGNSFGVMSETPGSGNTLSQYMYFADNGDIAADASPDGDWEQTRDKCERAFPEYGPQNLNWGVPVETVSGAEVGYWSTSRREGGGAFVDDGTYQGLVYFSTQPTNEIDYDYQIENLAQTRGNNLYVYDLADVESCVAGSIDPDAMRGRYYRWNASTSGGINSIARACSFDPETGYLWVYYPRYWSNGFNKFPIVAAYQFQADATTAIPVSAGISSSQVYKSGDLLAVQFDRQIQFPSTPNVTGLTLEVDSVSRSVTYSHGHGTNMLLLKPASTILTGETVTLSYDSGTGDLEDAGSSAVPSFTDFAITNNSTTEAIDSTPPTLNAANISPDGWLLTLVFNEAVTSDGGMTAGLGLSLAADESSVSLSSPYFHLSPDQARLTYQLGTQITCGQTVTLDYDDTTGNFKDTSSNYLVTFADFEVTNLADPNVAGFNSIFGLGDYDIRQEIVADFRCQETTGTTIANTVVGGGDGTTQNMGANPTTRTGPNGYLTSALDFDGSTSYVDLGTPSRSYLTGKNAFTVCFWYQSDFDSTEDAIFGSFDGGNDNDSACMVRMNYLDNQGHIVVLARASGIDDTLAGTITSDTGASDGSWHFVAVVVTLRTDSIRVFIDGVEQSVTLIDQDADAELWQTMDQNWYLGAYNDNAASNPTDHVNGGICGFTFAEHPWHPSLLEEIRTGPTLVNTVAPSLSITESSYALSLGTWDLPTPYAGLSNGTPQFDWEIRRSSDQAIVASGTNAASDPSGAGTFSTDSYYPWVRAKNSGGYDTSQDTSGAEISVTATSRPRNPRRRGRIKTVRDWKNQ